MISHAVLLECDESPHRFQSGALAAKSGTVTPV
jgi:hypothetical protein